jgi:hypothetical protein
MDANKAVKGLDGVVVLGMHRSGTSAVAGLLTKAGFFAGNDDELLPAAEDNPTGFFERLDINALNDRLLAELDGSWDNPPARELVAERAPEWRAKVDSALDVLAEEAAGRPVMLKDPRISLLLPAWLPALQDRFMLVVVDRNPLEVAMSVRKRDGRPLYVALALWQLYCTELLDGLAGRRVWLVRYEHLLSAAERETSSLLAELRGSLRPEAAAGLAGESEAAGFVSTKLRNQRSTAKGGEVERALTGGQLALWRWLCKLPEGWATLEPPSELRAQPEEALGPVGEHYFRVGEHYGLEVAYDTARHMALHFEQATELKDHHIELIEGQLGALKRQLAAQGERVAELEAAGDALRSENEALRDQLTALQEDGRAAAANLIGVARRSWTGRPVS